MGVKPVGSIGPLESTSIDVASSCLRLVADLLDAFEGHAIRYCYWKNSARVGEALAGHKDLDLLIGRSDQHRATALLAAHGFKLFPGVPGRDHPSVDSYLGFDEPSGRIVHCHVHFRLVVGEPLLKVFRLPWEDKLLARARRHPTLPVRVLDPAAEAVMTMLRASLEIVPYDPIVARRWATTRRLYAGDLAVLAARVPPADVADLAAELLGPTLAGRMVQGLVGDDPLAAAQQLRGPLAAAVAGYRLYGRLEGRLRALGRAVLWAAGGLNRRLVHAPRPSRLRVPGGGCVVALVGLDGSGKSTAVATLRQWLSAEADVMPIYFGTGEGRPSLLLLPFKLMVPLVEPLFARKPKGSSHGQVTGREAGPLYSVLMTVWATLVAAEKRTKLVAARRAAERGMIVIADRYPQNEILRFNDGPLLPRLRRAPGALRQFEQGAYARAQHMPPDLVLKLVVTPATAARREPTMDRGVISERVIQLRDLTFGSTRVVPIDAEQPLDAVIRALKREVWAIL